MCTLKYRITVLIKDFQWTMFQKIVNIFGKFGNYKIGAYNAYSFYIFYVLSWLYDLPYKNINILSIYLIYNNKTIKNYFWFL